MRELDHLTVALSGMNLIEASAGTGKTYAIACLYLRLLIERDLTEPIVEPQLADAFGVRGVGAQHPLAMRNEESLRWSDCRDDVVSGVFGGQAASRYLV